MVLQHALVSTAGIQERGTVGWTLAPRLGLGHGFRLINAIRCSRTRAGGGAGRVLADA